MTRDQAFTRCAQLNANCERDHEWFVKQVSAQDWELVTISMPGGSREPLKPTIEARPELSEPADLRSSLTRNIPPYGPA